MSSSYQFIICGIDRVGKGTLINAIQQKLGYASVIHYQKPLANTVHGSLESFQRASFREGFKILHAAQSNNFNLIFDRFHLGEYVYAPRYRGYSGDYVFDLEDSMHASLLSNVQLILLTTQNFNIMTDDNLSFDFTRRAEEQASFIEAFNKSSFTRKKIIQVNDELTGFYRSPEDIVSEII